MIILAVETTSAVCSVAILDNEELLGEYDINIKGKHSEKLFSGLHNILRDLKISVKNLEGVAVSIGPGSFTGIRVGISAVRALAQSLKIPLVGVTSLDVLALNAFPSDFFVCPIIDALRNEVYTALYKSDIKNKIRDYQLIDIDAWLKELNILAKENDKSIVFIGDALCIYKEKTIKLLGKRAIFKSFTNMYPSAANVGFLGVKELKEGGGKIYTEVLPFYIRKSAAEMRWKDTKAVCI